MKDKDLPTDNSQFSLEDLTDQADKIIESLENEKDLNNSIESYQELLKLNKVIEKKFHKNFKNISEETNKKVKDIMKKK
ncbi:exonuclease VII small subunit [Candidatus Pelagibacter sp.]|nr:exonuclease VII small subunit [Candidatus Pelagibacter sp.]|tara:strand:+ start:249 stop:485 length:237 start_codon:yes stop_codon:yes gene_type:complete